jgi:hypothetical protein
MALIPFAGQATAAPPLGRCVIGDARLSHLVSIAWQIQTMQLGTIDSGRRRRAGRQPAHRQHLSVVKTRSPIQINTLILRAVVCQYSVRR